MDIYYLRELAVILRDLITPIASIGMVILAIWVAIRKGLFSEVLKKPNESETPRPVVYGDGNIINLQPSEFQQRLTYDVNKFDEYHQQSISQSRISFWFSLLFASIGFVIIATSVFTYSEKAGYLGIVAGTIIDVVSALFFYQSNKARQLMSEFFDKLRSDRNHEESLKLCETIDNTHMRNALKLRLSLFFSGLADSEQISLQLLRLSTAADPATPSHTAVALATRDREEANAPQDPKAA